MAPSATLSRISINQLLQVGAQRLLTAGIENPRREARLLLSYVSDLSVELLIRDPEKELTPVQADQFMTVVKRRENREPFARIVGIREFWGLPFRINEKTLVPRPDSEVLVAAALEILADREPEKFIVDLGTGTGCLLLSILHHHSKATGVGIDISEKALDMAKANAESLNLGTRARFEIGNFVQKDRFTTIMAKADLIVCNPPYIATDEIPLLDPEVCQYDPYQAIDGGIDGLACYRALFPEVKACLKPEGRAIFEIGYRQSGAVAGLAERYNLRVYRMAYDLSGHKRAVILGQP